MGRRRRRKERKAREKEAATSMAQSPSQAENFVRARLGNTVGNKAVGGTATAAATAPAAKTSTPSTSSGSWSTPAKKQLEGRPNPVNILRFSPQSWSKLQWFRDRGSTEIGGFGISLKEEPLYVIDFLTVAQQCTTAGVEFDDDSVARLLDEMDKKGYTPDEVLRIWLHTHPGNSASPSGTDMNTFRDVFGSSDWSIMVILARGGECKARLRYTNGPGAELELTPQVDLHPPFEGVSADDYKAWEEEYVAHVRTRSYSTTTYSGGHHSSGYQGHGSGRYCGPYYDGDYGEGWWNERQNDDTSGFRPQGGAQSRAVESHRSYSSQGSSSDRSRVRLSDQVEVPPYGGTYRLASREEDANFRLVNACVEQVWQVDDNDDDTKTVITDLAWYNFSRKARVNADVGDDIDSIHDISDEAPIACGEVAWRVNAQDKLVPLKITRVLSSGEVVDLRSNEDVAVAELFTAQQKGSSSKSDDSAGFAPAAGEETKDEKKTETKALPLPRSNWDCAVCKKPIDHKKAYMVANTRPGAGGNLGDRAHVECVKDKAGWMEVPERPSKRETEIITVGSVAAASASKGNDEPGFGPAASDGDADGSSDGNADGGTAAAVADAPVGP